MTQTMPPPFCTYAQSSDDESNETLWAAVTTRNTKTPKEDSRPLSVSPYKDKDCHSPPAAWWRRRHHKGREEILFQCKRRGGW